MGAQAPGLPSGSLVQSQAKEALQTLVPGVAGQAQGTHNKCNFREKASALTTSFMGGIPSRFSGLHGQGGEMRSSTLSDLLFKQQ